MCIDTAHLWAEGYSPEEMIKYKPTIIHLNGNRLNKSSHRDIHVDPLSPTDLIWTKSLLKKFIHHFANTPMICETQSQKVP